MIIIVCPTTTSSMTLVCACSISFTSILYPVLTQSLSDNFFVVVGEKKAEEEKMDQYCAGDDVVGVVPS